MNKILSFLVLSATLTLSGCATTQNAQDGLVVACTAYSSAFEAALTLREQGKLTPTQIQAVTLLDSQVTPLCTGQLPADITTAITEVTAAITTLAATVAIQKASK